MTTNPLGSLHRLVWTALFAALIAIGALINVPMVPVPMTLQTMFVLLAGFILGPVYGTSAVGLYLAAGLVGLPVFSGGGSGLGHIMGPTGGYLFGFALSAAITGIARSRGDRGWFLPSLLGAVGTLAIFIPGGLWLKATMGMTYLKALNVGILPFIPGAVVKIAMAVAAYLYLRKRRLLPQ